MTLGQPCPFGDLFCPCVDGDACHYVDLPGSPAMKPPRKSKLEKSPYVTATEGDTFDRMRKALGNCTFLPASSDKRFARQISQMHLHMITERQRRHVIRLAWEYRRQMPYDLVPSKDAVQAIDSGWHEETVAGISVMTTTKR